MVGELHSVPLERKAKGSQKLHDDGLISDAKYAQLRKEIMALRSQPKPDSRTPLVETPRKAEMKGSTVMAAIKTEPTINPHEFTQEESEEDSDSDWDFDDDSD